MSSPTGEAHNKWSSCQKPDEFALCWWWNIVKWMHCHKYTFFKTFFFLLGDWKLTHLGCGNLMLEDLNKTQHTVRQKARGREQQWWCDTADGNQCLHLQQREGERDSQTDRKEVRRRDSEEERLVTE